MKREFCVAAVRLVYDIIGADGYVSDCELDIMDNVLNDKYGLNDPDSAREIVREVNKKTFCDALKTLQDWEEKQEVYDLIDDLKLIAGVGNYKP